MESIRQDESRMEVGRNPGAPRQEKGQAKRISVCLSQHSLATLIGRTQFSPYDVSTITLPPST